jgi:hypothetical protein
VGSIKGERSFYAIMHCFGSAHCAIALLVGDEGLPFIIFSFLPELLALEKEGIVRKCHF